MSAIYNEIDRSAAQWMRNLIAGGHIADGVVDERSIADLAPADVSGHGHRHFFAGIGGWAYALRLAGVPDTVDIWTGSCPCQPFSNAGRQQGTNDKRHIWPEWFRLIAECRPAIIVGEQVASKAALGWLDAVFADLEGAGYACAAADLPAAGVGAPHIRQRLYFVAHADGEPGRLLAQEWKSRRADAQAERSGEAGGCLADRTRMRRSERLDVGKTKPKRGRGSSDGRRAVGVANGNGAGLEVVGEQQARRQLEAAERGSAADWLGNANGLERGPRIVGQQFRSDDGCSPDWSACDWISCSDGKSRPVEPGTHPLVYGVRDRVGLLRGYGNAIVPQQAAAFVTAALEAIA